jgi:hypothetical protein
MRTFFLAQIRFRPLPGSRVTTTPAHTQGAGAPETANPPKAHERAETTAKRDGFLIRSVSANNCNQGSYEDA